VPLVSIGPGQRAWANDLPPPVVQPVKPKDPTSGFGRSSWIVLGIVALALIGLVIIASRLGSQKRSAEVDSCIDACRTLPACGSCSEMCRDDTELTRACARSSSTCDDFRSCMK
jgi:hypothetical protein